MELHKTECSSTVETGEDDNKLSHLVVSKAIGSSPEIVNVILNHMSARHVTKCSRVSNMWRMYSKRILEKRQTVAWMFVRQTRPKEYWVPFAEKSAVIQFFEEMDEYPGFVLGFGTLPLSRPCDGGSDLIYLQRRFLPPNALVVGGMSNTHGVIGTMCDSYVVEEFQRPAARTEIFSCLLFPQSLPAETMSLHPFVLSLDTLSAIRSDVNDGLEFDPTTQFDADLLKPKAPDTQLKALVILTAPFVCPDFGSELCSFFYEYSRRTSVARRESHTVAIAGGIVEDIVVVKPEARETSSPSLFCLAIYGNERVQSESIVIPPDCRSKKSIRAVMYNFRRQFPPDPDDVPVSGSKSRVTRNSEAPGPSGLNAPICVGGGSNFKDPLGHTHFAFIFICCGRGKNLHSSRNVETGIFREFFPRTPVIGAFSLGEYGYNSFDTAEPVPSDGAPSADATNEPVAPILEHSYSTVICVVSVRGI